MNENKEALNPISRIYEEIEKLPPFDGNRYPAYQRPDQDGAIAPLRNERQAFLDSFMRHAETYIMMGANDIVAGRLRVLLGDAWYDGYIAGERHANSDTSSQTVRISDSPELLTNPHPDPKP